MMNCVNKMALSPDIKPEIIDLEDTESVDSSKQGLDTTPEWILVFTKELLKINGQRCPETLDRMMGEYLELMRVELMKCQISPNRSYHIASKMQKFLAYFYGYYQDIREFFVVTRWNENVVELMAIYSYLELKAAIRLNRRETDQALASRIYKMLYLYFDGNEEHIIHTFLKTPMSNLKCKSIYDLIFRKVLVTNRTKRPQTHTDLEYIRNLLCFKIWKTMYPKSEKQIVTNYTMSHNKPPSNLSNCIRKFRFIPKGIDHSDLHNKLCTIPLQIDDGIREYFERLESKNGKHFGSVKSSDKKTFISRLFDVFSNIGSTTEDAGDSFMDNLLLDQIKTETEEICFDEDENSDDDCIFVDPDAPAPPPPVIEPPVEILIDLTNNEPDTEDGDSTELTPTWCLRLLNQVNTADEALLQPVETVCEPVEVQPENSQCSDYEIVNNKLKDCELVNKLTDCQPVNLPDVESVNNKSSIHLKTDRPVVNDIEMDCEPVKKLTDCEPDNQKPAELQAELPVINGYNTAHLQKDCEPVNILATCKSVNKGSKRIKSKPTSLKSTDCQPVNGTSKHCKPADIPKLRSAEDFESENCKTDSHNTTIDKPVITKPVYLEPEYIQPTDCEPVICNTINGKLVTSNIINGYSVKETDFENFETINNNVSLKPSVVEPVNTTNCEPVELEPANRSAEDVVSHSEIDSAEVEEYLNDLQTETELCEPVTRNINRENINKTPLDIIDDFCASEDEYSLPEITSTSHDFVPVKLQSLSAQTRENMQSPVRNQTLTAGSKIPKVLDPNNWDQSFDRADSTSNFNESTITPFSVEENTDLRDDDSFSAMSSDGPSPITNMESFTKHSTNHSIEMIVSTPIVHDLSKQVLDQSDATSETSSVEGNLVINADADEISPTMEPISGNDYANYLSTFEHERYSEYQKDSELVVNKNVKIRTYNSSKPRPKPVAADEPRVSVIAQPERRVPLNGEKVLRFETELWEPVFLQTFKLTKKEYQLFNPQAKVRKSDKRDYGIFDDEIELGLLYGSGGTAIKGGCSGMEALHAPVYNTAKTKTILERQDYVKGEKQTRALVETRPLRSKSVARKCGEASTQPVATNQAKKRGTKNSTTDVAKKRKLSRKKTAITTPDSETRDEQTISPWRY